MSVVIPGIHHVTAVTGAASRNVSFYTEVLGLRLVKKTVNQDDVGAYHLFYGDRVGTPGTEVTFFDWPDSPPARPGAATIAPIGLAVSPGSLEWWQERLQAAGIEVGEIEELAPGTPRLAFSDPEGQRLELVGADGGPARRSWDAPGIPEQHRLAGIHDVTVTSLRPELSRVVLTEVLGFRLLDRRAELASQGLLSVYGTDGAGPGSQVRLRELSAPSFGRVGIGGVHHVAFRCAGAEEQEEWRATLLQNGLQVTPVIDRYYFRSIYFREPGGALFEIATDGPGFTSDEAEGELGQRLSLPPFLEGRREVIEAGLRPL